MIKKKLILINPVNSDVPLISSNLTSKYPPLGLGIVAKITPSNWDVEIIDENFEKFNFRTADLVGITAFTSNVFRAYEISRVYKEAGIKVIFGGIHASVMPDEVIEYCDAVVIGEAEDTWPKVILDFENNQLKKFYQSNYPDLKNVPIIDHKIFDNRYIFLGIQTSRGCYFRCDFCSVHKFNQGLFRRKPIENVLTELESVKDMNKLIFIIDDNIAGATKEDVLYLKTLFNEIIHRKYNFQWFCQASINFVNDEELVQLAAKSGCKLLFVGIEAESIEALNDMNKKVNLSASANNYKKFIKTIHKYGMLVSAGIIFGTESDTEETLEKRLKFILKSNIDIFQVTPITPLPGTSLFQKLMSEKRIVYTDFPNDWNRFHLLEVVYEPNKISQNELKKILQNTYNKIYSKKNIYFRFMKSVFQTKKIKTSLWALQTNFSYRNILFKK